MKIYFAHPDTEVFIASLEKITIAKVLRTVDLLEKFNYKLGPPHTKKITKDIFELRIRGQQEVRLFYTFSHGTIIILRGFIKKTQQIPSKELNLAIKRRISLDTA